MNWISNQALRLTFLKFWTQGVRRAGVCRGLLRVLEGHGDIGFNEQRTLL